MVVLLATGCARDGEESHPDAGAVPYVTFRVVAPKAMMTRAVSHTIPDVDGCEYWSDDYLSDDGTSFDNALLKNGFNVFFTQPDGTRITKLENLLCFETTVSEEEVIFTFSGQVPQADAETLKSYSNARIHIAANCSSGTTLTDDLNFSHAGQPSATFTAIPMWGVKECDFTTLHPGQNDVGEIWLLRAMAKVEIVIGQSVPGKNNIITELTSASVTNVNTQGYLLPQEWNNWSDTRSVSFEKSLRALPSVSEISGMTPSSDGKIVFYIPETENAGGATKIKLNYATDLEDFESGSGEIEFAKYVDGKPSDVKHDIVRNHLYCFEVFLTNKSQLSIKYTVCPWLVYEITPPTFD